LAALLFVRGRAAASKLRPTLGVVFALANLPWVKPQNQTSHCVGWLVEISVGRNSWPDSLALTLFCLNLLLPQNCPNAMNVSG
jgi:hypothetical protein